MSKSPYPILYRGSVKNLRIVTPPGKTAPGKYLFEFTDDYSVFDYGKMPDAIRGKGCAIAMMSAHLFEQLESAQSWKRLFRREEAWEGAGGDELRVRLRRSPAGRGVMSRGLRTHYLGLLDDQGRCRTLERLEAPSNRLLVKAVPVLAPRRMTLDGRLIWDYSPFSPNVSQYLIPLENVFRFGVPQGSSLLERLKRNPAYAKQIGLESLPREGEWLSRPVLEFFSKLEPMDRFLTPETALNFSGLTGDLFGDLWDLSLLVAVFLHDLFRSRGLELWDGKFEFVKVRSEILLADSITPDELRITHGGNQLSKEPLRQYYKRRDPEFLRVLADIKDEGAPLHGSVRSEVKKRLNRPPSRLDPAFRRNVEEMYRALTFCITGSRFFAGGMDLEEVIGGLEGM